MNQPSDFLLPDASASIPRFVPESPRVRNSGPFDVLLEEEQIANAQFIARIKGEASCSHLSCKTTSDVQPTIFATRDTTGKSVLDILNSVSPRGPIIWKSDYCSKLDSRLCIDCKVANQSDIEKILHEVSDARSRLKGALLSDKKVIRDVLKKHKNGILLLEEKHQLFEMIDKSMELQAMVDDFFKGFSENSYFNSIARLPFIFQDVTRSEDLLRAFVYDCDARISRMHPDTLELDLYKKKFLSRMGVLNKYILKLKDRLLATMLVNDARVFSEKTDALRLEVCNIKSAVEFESFMRKGSLQGLQLQAGKIHRVLDSFSSQCHHDDWYVAITKELKKGEKILSNIQKAKKESDEFFSLSRSLVVSTRTFENKFGLQPLASPADGRYAANIRFLYEAFTPILESYAGYGKSIHSQGVNPDSLFTEEFLQVVRGLPKESIFQSLAQLSRFSVYISQLQSMIAFRVPNEYPPEMHQQVARYSSHGKLLQKIQHVIDLVSDIYRSAVL